MTTVRYNSVDNETGVSYAVVVGEDHDTAVTVGVVTRESDQKVWTALATGRKVALKDEFTTRKAAAEALIVIAEEKAARAAERKIARLAAKAEELALRNAEEADKALLGDEAVVADKATDCCGEPETCEVECPAEAADPVEVHTADGPTVTWVTTSGASTVSGATLTGSIPVSTKPTLRSRVRKFFGRG